jgi:hypothetical protein
VHFPFELDLSSPSLGLSRKNAPQWQVESAHHFRFRSYFAEVRIDFAAVVEAELKQLTD